MQALPVNVYSAAVVRDIDRTAIDDRGIPGYTLMTRAGAAAVQAALERFPHARRWQVFCGAGNNGGDGYVLARLAAAAGIDASVLTLSDPHSLAGDANQAAHDFMTANGSIAPWDEAIDPQCDLLVDAMLGSGLQRDVSGAYAAAVAAINAADRPVLALDIPTGLHADSGAVLGIAVHADLTVTFVGLKQGLYLGAGPDVCGELRFSDLEIPADCYADKPVAFRRIDRAAVNRLLPRRERQAHKGDFGHVLVIGGGEGMPGAVLLCGEGALRAGAGRVSIATAPSHAAIIVKSRPELMSHGIASVADIEPLLARANVVAFGPGLGRTPWAAELVARMATLECPSVWDADALNWLAATPAQGKERIITPHPGEAATLLGITTAAVQADRPGALRVLQERYGGTVVLKGAGTLVSSDSGAPFLCTAGNPGMAAPGMGDVLTGVIAALLSQGLSREDAACAGVDIHARAGDAAATAGERGLIASDLLDQLRGMVNP